MARLTDGTFIEPFTMNDPKEKEKVLVKLAVPTAVRIGHRSSYPFFLGAGLKSLREHFTTLPAGWCWTSVSLRLQI